MAIGRKNWLLAGSEAGGACAATLYSVIYTCKRLGLNPLEYMRDVLVLVATHPRSKLWELTPRGWLEARGRA
ncbi:MAG: transposase domain-containing protein [Planctomycetes bacterium]|nr:transposase domain-containing protein [Planctomycetota bacterium]